MALEAPRERLVNQDPLAQLDKLVNQDSPDNLAFKEDRYFVFVRSRNI